MTTMWAVRGGAVLATDCVSGRWAKYDDAGVRTGVPTGWKADRELPTDEMLAAMDADAPAKAAELLAAESAKRAAADRAARVGAVAARFDGVCAVSGRRYRRGAMIARFGGGWALADAVATYGGNDQTASLRGADLGRLMDRADSTL